jgi:hypothetical protein
MKDLIEISVNGKVVASHEQIVEGESPLQRICGVRQFSVEIYEDALRMSASIRIGKNCPADYVENKVAPIVEPMEKKVSVDEWAGSLNPDKLSTPVQKQMEEVSTPAPTYNEIPIKTRKPRGPNKPKEEVVEKSVFDKPVEETVVEPVVEKPAEVKKAPAVATPTTPARVNELGKLIKMWSKASGLGIDYVSVDRLKAEAFDIVENDSDETIVAGIGEAGRLMTT